MIGNWAFDFLHQSGSGDAQSATRFQESRQVDEIEVIRAIVGKRIDADHRVEELRGERQCARVRVDGEDAFGNAGVSNPQEILSRAEPKVGGPNLNSELTVQEDR
jgi:hypothetical protein